MKNVKSEINYGGIMPHSKMKKIDLQKKGDGIAKKSKRKKWKKPKDKPNRPLSAYNIFFRDERRKLMSVNNGLSVDKKVGFAALARHISAKWKALDEDSKKAYKMPANLEQIRYKLELAEWRKKQSIPKKEDADSNACSSKEVSNGKNQEEHTPIPIEKAPEVGKEISMKKGPEGTQKQSFPTIKRERVSSSIQEEIPSTIHTKPENQEEHYSNHQLISPAENNGKSVETLEDAIMTVVPLQSHSETSKSCSPITESKQVESQGRFPPSPKQEARASLGVLLEAMEKNAEKAKNERIEIKPPAALSQNIMQHTQESKHVGATTISSRQLMERAIYESQYVNAYQWMKNQQQQSSLVSLIKIMKDMEQEKEEAVNQVILLREEVQRLQKEFSRINPQHQHRNERIIGDNYTFIRPTDIFIEPKNVAPTPVISNPNVLNRT